MQSSSFDDIVKISNNDNERYAIDIYEKIRQLTNKKEIKLIQSSLYSINFVRFNPYDIIRLLTLLEPHIKDEDIHNIIREKWIYQTLAKWQDFTPDQFANVIKILAITNYDNKKIINLWIKSFLDNNIFTQIENLNFCQIIHYLAKFDLQTPLMKSFVQSWTEIAITKIYQFNSQYLAMTISAIAKLDYYNKDFIKAFIKAASEKLHHFNHIDLSYTINALAKFNYNDEYFIKSWISTSLNILNAFSPRHLSLSLNSLAKLNKKWSKIWLKEVREKIDQFKAWHLSASLESLVLVDYYDLNFMKIWLENAKKNFAFFENKDLVNNLHILAKFNYIDQEFIHISLKNIRNTLSSFDSKDLTKILESLVMFNCKYYDFFIEWMEIAQIKLKDFDQQELTQVLKAIAILKCYDEKFVENLIKAAKEKINDFSLANVYDIIESLANLDLNDDNFVDLLRLRLSESHSVEINHIKNIHDLNHLRQTLINNNLYYRNSEKRNHIKQQSSNYNNIMTSLDQIKSNWPFSAVNHFLRYEESLLEIIDKSQTNRLNNQKESFAKLEQIEQEMRENQIKTFALSEITRQLKSLLNQDTIMAIE